MKINNIAIRAHINQLKKFDWVPWKEDWDAGYLILGGDLGASHSSSEDEFYGYDLDDFDIGIIVFTREYVCGEWDDNIWTLRIIPAKLLNDNGCGLCLREMHMLCDLLEALQKSNDPFPDSVHINKDIYDRRMAIEAILRS